MTTSPLEINNSHIKQEYPRVSGVTSSSQQTLNDLGVDADIIAVQGLASSYEWTWSTKSYAGDDQRFYWLRELLPKDVPRSRILTFEYDSKWYDDPAHVTLEECGKRLLDCLVKDRTHRGHTRICRGRRKRPIIFIGHSFGGLVIKQALVLANQTHHDDPSYADRQDILFATAGIIFLATPHRGSAFSTLAKLKMKLGSLVGISTYPELVSILDLRSSALGSLQENFQKILSLSSFNDLKLFCFYETKELRTGLVVERESACIGIGGEQSLEANHFEMNKFGPHEENYRNYVLFVTQLRVMYREGLEVVQRRFAAMQYTSLDPSPKLLRIKDWLSPSRGQRQRLSDLLKERQTPDSCQWVLETDEYQNWNHHESDNNCLWIHGKAGSGKSVLASFLVSTLSGTNRGGQNCDSGRPFRCDYRLDTSECTFDPLRRRDPTALYFFEVEPSGSSTAIFLGTLIHQLLMSFDEDRRLVSIVEQSVQKFPEPTEDSLLSLLMDLAEVVGALYILLDGLDESVRWNSLLLPLASLRASTAVRIIIFSQFDRHKLSTIETTFGPTYLSFDIVHHSHRDIRTFIHAKASELVSSRPSLASMCDFIEENVLVRSDGMFQWVSLVMKYLLEHAFGPEDVKTCLEDCPPSLNATYARILRRLTYDAPARQRHRIATTLRWLAAAGRPITIREMRLAIALRESDDNVVHTMLSLTPDFNQGDSELEVQFSSLLGSLVKLTNAETDSGIVSPHKVMQLCHASLRQLLLSGDELALGSDLDIALLSDFCLPATVAHARCAEECFDLCATSVALLADASHSLLQHSQLLHYSWEYCIYHLQHSGPLYATSQLPQKLDRMLKEVVTDTLILLECLRDALCRLELDSKAPSHKKRRLRTVNMENALALQNALDSIPPAVEDLLTLRRFLPLTETLVQVESALKAKDGDPSDAHGWAGRLRHVYYKVKAKYWGVAQEAPLELEEMICGRMELLPVYLASSIPLARAAKRLHTVMLNIVDDRISIKLRENGTLDPAPALALVATVLEGVMNAPYRLPLRDVLPFQTLHDFLHDPQRHRDVALLSGKDSDATISLLRRVHQRQPFPIRRFLLVNGVLRLLRSGDDGIFSLVLNPVRNYWLRQSALMDIPGVHYLAHPEVNLAKTVQDGNLFHFRDTSAFIASIPTLCVIWAIKYVQTLLELFSPYTWPIIQICITRLKIQTSTITSTFGIFSRFGIMYCLAALPMYLLRCKYFPSWGAAMNKWPDIRTAVLEPWNFTPQKLTWLQIAAFYVGYVAQVGVFGATFVVAPLTNLRNATGGQPWYHHLMHAYQVFWFMTALERAVNGMANVLSFLVVPIGIIAFHMDSEGLWALCKYTFAYWNYAGSTMLADFAAVAMESVGASLGLRILLIVLVVLLNRADWLLDAIMTWILRFALWITYPFHGLVSWFVTWLRSMINLRSLVALIVLWAVVWLYSYFLDLLMDPYEMRKTRHSLNWAKSLVYTQISHERIRQITERFADRPRITQPPQSLPTSNVTHPTGLPLSQNMDLPEHPDPMDKTNERDEWQDAQAPAVESIVDSGQGVVIGDVEGSQNIQASDTSQLRQRRAVHSDNQRFS